MRGRGFVLVLFVVAVGCALFRVGSAEAQQPKSPAKAAPVAGGYQPKATLAQVMRGILFPNSNVIFYAQNHDPAQVKQDADPTMATDPLSTVYGGWPAVENSSLALSEAANLLVIPGRLCSNGRPVPLQNA